MLELGKKIKANLKLMEIQDMNCLAVLKREKWCDNIFKVIIISDFFYSPHSLFLLKYSIPVLLQHQESEVFL